MKDGLEYRSWKVAVWTVMRTYRNGTCPPTARLLPRHSQALLILTLLFVALPRAGALERTMSFGGDQLWANLASSNAVVLRSGESGLPVLALRTDEYTPRASTDLLLHFDGGTPTDAAGHYRTDSSSIDTSQRWARLGRGAGVFQGHYDPLLLSPSSPDAMLAPGKVLHDFTIEFWLYPATLSDGETVFLWRGARKDGGRILPQSLRCEIEGSRLIWTFTNLFVPPSQGTFTVRLRGNENLIPRRWYHDTLRFDRRTGMIEFLVDGRPDAIGYANRAGKENGVVYMPYAGTAAESRISIGSEFIGFLDELRLSSDFVSRPVDHRYARSGGTAITNPIDLGYTDSTVTSISAVDRTPGNTAVLFYYRTANAETAPNELPGSWTQFAPNAPLSSPPNGRFIQFKIELLPDGRAEQTPTVRSLSLTYQPRLPPPAPALLTATPGNGRVTLRWHKVIDANLKGYEVFYGDRPGVYFGTDSSSGSSPIDVGNTTSFDVQGLTNGKLYYFAVAAYDTSSPPHLSAFSNEVAARPTTLAGAGS